jgi:hypothetical protein
MIISEYALNSSPMYRSWISGCFSSMILSMACILNGSMPAALTIHVSIIMVAGFELRRTLSYQRIEK